MDTDRSDSSGQSKAHPGPDDDKGSSSVLVQGLRESSSTTSSSSSCPSVNDLFEVDTRRIGSSSTYTALPNPNVEFQPTLKDDATPSPKPSEDTKIYGDAQSSLKNGITHSLKSPQENDETSDSSCSSSEFQELNKKYLVVSSPLPVSDLTGRSLPQSSMLTQSPPRQVMERSEGYEPDRIPSSVFARSKSVSPMDWSVASNESLFSLHLGNNSFSRDQFFAWSGDIGKSGELMKSGEFIMFTPTLPVTEEEDRKSENMETNKYRENGAADEATGDVERKTSDHQRVDEPPTQVSWNSSSLSSHSERSTTSTLSFAFPVLTEVKSSSTRAENEQNPSQDTSEMTSNSTTSTWFPWFSCFSCSCLSFRPSCCRCFC